MKKIAIFDIDGTIFRSSLFIELTNGLIQEGIFSPKIEKSYSWAYKNWLDRKGSYDDYLWKMVRAFDKNLKGVNYQQFMKVARKIARFYQNRVYRYTRDLIKDLKEKNYYLLALSHSPQEVVEEFCKKLNFNRMHGLCFEVGKNGYFTGKKTSLDFLKDKTTLLKRIIAEEKLSLKSSIGVGDSEGDIPVLKLVAHPICFNPSQKLYQYAKKAGWKIVVERKNVIYKF